MSIENIKDKIEKEVAELTGSLSKVIATFKSMKTPLIESHGKVPQATVQLDKVVDQTEAAASGMLDNIEQITEREEEIIADLKGLRNEVGSWDAEEIGEVVDRLIQKAETNLNDVFHVMDALQFQDITSQKIQHAAAVLEELEVKLQHVISVVGGEEELPDEGAIKKDRVYDPHADLYERKTEQADVDSLFSKNGKS